MVEITKEVVLDWYQRLSAPRRVELICALLEHSLPFELRFLGTVIENLGRKDFHVLREADNKANALHSSSSDGPVDVADILKVLFESPATSNLAINPQIGVGLSNSGGGAGASNESRPNSVSTTLDRKTGDKGTGQPLTESTATAKENGLITSNSSSPVSSHHFESNSNDKEDNKREDIPNHVESNNEDDSETEPKKDLWMYDSLKRRKLILYLSVMTATNHDSANLYYRLLSDVDELLENLDWFERLDAMVQDEILLLYTIGSYHPAFSFDQRRLLASVCRLQDCIVKNSRDRETQMAQPAAPPSSSSSNPTHALTGGFSGSGDGMQSHHKPHGVVNRVYGQSLNGPHASGLGNPPNLGVFHGFQTTLSFGFPCVIPQGSYRPPSNPVPLQQRPGGFVPNGFPTFASVENSIIPGLEDTVEIRSRPRSISCYNCGSNKHSGPECNEMSMEEMTKVQYRLNYGGDTKEGD